MLIDRMTKSQLEAEIGKQTKILNGAIKSIDKIHGTRDYSDEIAKHFHMGKVGFRPDQKKQAQTLDRAINNGVKACELYDTRDRASSIIAACQKAIDYIIKNSPDGKVENYSKHAIVEMKRKAVLAAAPEVKWEKSKGVYGTAYTHGSFEVEKVDADFVAVRRNGELVTHCKTIKEAKAKVSIYVSTPA
ncbi:hypothetical protein M7775_06000 [Sporomusa sphaeroides DSM 2875]|uniref:hypothetical protein n=1 Tax=Sporomusa sphaeroides TaxID=47679 RepID=UPI00202FE53E|nr:hypothetical protein [Sporomusa sphaeroides]MCM0758128.1 hypothetical protein [Sporomusa sphaeroides DSM 2875]